MDYDDLRAKADAATPGRWVRDDGYPSVGDESGDILIADCGQREAHDDANADFIAAADPQTVLALLDRVEELEAEKAQMRGMVQRALPTLIAEAQADLAALGEDTE